MAGNLWLWGIDYKVRLSLMLGGHLVGLRSNRGMYMVLLTLTSTSICD